MAKESRRASWLSSRGSFNYFAPLDPTVAKKVQTAAEHIRETVKRTIEGIIEVGQDLIGVKEALPPTGIFGP